MKIFSVIKKYFKNIKTKMKLKFFKKYLIKLEDAFLCLEFIEEPNEDILNYYNLIKLNDKYSSYTNKFVALTSKIESHNKLVDKINLFVRSFSFNEKINKINMITKEEINELLKIVEHIKSFKTYDKNYQVFIREVEELNSNEEEILRQFEIEKEISEFYNAKMTKNYYMDGREALYVKEKIKKAVDEINQYSKQYFKITQQNNLNENIEIHNNNYINNNINNKIFEDVNGRSLGIDQRKAILTDSISNLVIAGAGSGKTLTICGKAKWLLEDQKIHEDEIVFLSYSKASADDLKEKLSKININLNVSTFHSLGLRILESESNIKQNIELNFDAIVQRFFSKEMLESQNIDMLRRVLEFYANYSYPMTEEKYETEGELFEKLKDSDFQTLNQILINFSNNPEEKETILKEKVKSLEELSIANFYYLNGIEYRYERPFEIDTSSNRHRQYNPDFTLIEYNIYHEHYGIDRNGKNTIFTKEAEEKYNQNIQWKENIHNKHNTKLIKSYSYEVSEGIIFEELTKKLKNHGVELKPISGSEVRKALNSIYKNRNFGSIIKLVKTFINLYKSKYPDNTYFETLKKEKFESKYEKQRAILFLDICKDIYDYYKSELNGKIDFDDMILEAIRIIPSSNNFKYKYIVVDEFQDISSSRMELLRTLIKHGNSKIFAVGDDWQSIYRFAGSDLGIFTKFKNYFNMATETRLLNNFRNSKELHEIVEPFITANPEQVKKTITCNNRVTNPAKIVYYNSNKEHALNKTLSIINEINSKANVLLLGRNNLDIDEYLSKNIQINRKGIISHSNYLDMNIYFKTVHASKGLEAEFVIIINNENDRVGFPNKIEDDPLLSLVLSEHSSFQYAEERRLYYVALTRTKAFVYLLVNANKPSEFIEEIKSDCEIINPELIDNTKKESCPDCKKGNLVLRGKWGNQFYGCSNYPYCNYNQKKNIVESSKRCPVCDHFIIWRNGPNRKFLGCTNYPDCSHTIYTNEYDFDYWKPNFDKHKKTI